MADKNSIDDEFEDSVGFEDEEYHKMKYMMFFVIFLIIASTAFGQDFVFRGLPWGSSKEDIIQKGGNPAKQRTDEEKCELYYDVKLADMDTMLIFTLHSNKLLEARYSIDFFNDEIDEQRWIAILESIELNLIALYGKPFEKRFINGFNLWVITWIVNGTKITFICEIGKDPHADIRYESPSVNPYGGL
jgi:hypothetical protein